MNRTLKSIVPTHTVLEGGGFKVRRPAAMGRLMSPFLLLDEMGPVDYAPGEAVGAPDHPHRGFETVTYLLAGGMKHADSAGNSGDFNPGDVQWMTAGRGVIHSELPQDHMMENGGLMHGFQIWVNLPAKDKMMPPRYQDIPSADLPETTSEDGQVWAKVIAGEALGVKAVIATSFERIHRSNLVGMGVLPLTFKDGESHESLGLTGQESYTIPLGDDVQPLQWITVQVDHPDGKTSSFEAQVRLDTPVEVEYYRNGGILHTVLREVAQSTA